jgi:hypothetical protein
MNKKILISGSLLVFLLTGYASIQSVQAKPSLLIAQSIWKPFSSKEGGFRVLMPGTPTQEQRTTKTQMGAFPTNTFSVIREQEAGYVVGYLDFPKNLSLNSRNQNQYLTAVATGFAQGAGGRLVSQRNIRLRNLPGKEIRLQFEQGVIGRGRMFLDNKRLYVAIAITDKESSLTKSIQGFLDSFQLVNRSTGSGKPAPPKPTIDELNGDLKQAVCGQNWPQALKVIEQMIAIAPSPEARDQLVTYRTQVQGLANSGSQIPPESLPGCTPSS